MAVSSISFGKKIPLIKCHIKDNVANKYIPATFYEVDCEDINEIDEVRDSLKGWQFSKSISQNMRTAYMMNKCNSLFTVNDEYFYEPETDAFYEMRIDDGEIVGICQVSKHPKDLHIEFIESKGNKQYKYVGQTMIAAIGRVAKHEKLKKIYIPMPIPSAIDFYINKCGFEHCNEEGIALYMKTSKSNATKIRTEARVRHPIIDLMV